MIQNRRMFVETRTILLVFWRHLQKEPAAAGFHFMSFQYPLIFPEFCVECSFLQRPQFQCKSRTQFTEGRFVALFLELVPMMSKKYEVSLVVEGDHAAAPKIRVMRKQ